MIRWYKQESQQMKTLLKLASRRGPVAEHKGWPEAAMHKGADSMSLLTKSLGDDNSEYNNLSCLISP